LRLWLIFEVINAATATVFTVEINRQKSGIPTVTETRFKTFEELCVSEEEDVSTYLGVLRMDVDNLGKVFIYGLNEKEKSFAAYATLSAQLDWFFSGYLNTIRDRYKDWINILYSGGDDVFAVGRWDKLIEFASEIREKFHQFTSERDDISLSAGLVIVRPKFPISKAADEAGDAEAMSKKYRKPESTSDDKNAFTFFGTTVSWDDEYDEVKRLKDEFVKHCGEGGHFGKAILHQLINWSSMVKLNENLEKPEKKPNYQYKWHTAYYLKRYQDRVRKKDAVAHEF
jgi:CRISPR-associated protein Csm1